MSVYWLLALCVGEHYHRTPSKLFPCLDKVISKNISIPEKLVDVIRIGLVDQHYICKNCSDIRGTSSFSFEHGNVRAAKVQEFIT